MPHDVVVVGAGLAGLSAARDLVAHRLATCGRAIAQIVGADHRVQILDHPQSPIHMA